MNLPIDVVPNTNPPLFKWTQVVGGVVQQCEGMLPPSCESAVAALVKVAKDALSRNLELRVKLDAALSRLADSQKQETVKAKVPMPSAQQPNRK